MPVYVLAGPAVALIGIISVFFVMRRRAVDKRSMYSSRRSQIERKVRAARQRTLVPRGRGDKPPTEQEIAATGTSVTSASPFQAPAYQAPVPQQAWEMGASPAAQAPAAPVYEPPPSAPPSAPPEPSVPAAEPVWTPAPAEPVWTPAPAADVASGPAPVAEPAAEPAPAEPLTPAGGGASWSIVGAEVPESAERAPAADRDKKKDKQKEKQAAGNAWQLASGNAPGAAEDEDEGPRRPSAAMALAQYAVLVVGLVMVLIGVLVMVANSKVT